MGLRRTLLGCTAIVTTLAFLTSLASATPITVSGTSGSADAQQRQIGGGNLQSALGSNLNVDLSFTYTSDTQGTWTATISNTSGTNPLGLQGTLAAFGLDLNSSFNWTDTGFSASPANLSDATTNANVLQEINAASDASGVDGFFSVGDVTLAAGIDGGDAGVAPGQSITLQWTVTGTGFSGHTDIADFLDPQSVDVAADATGFTADWVGNFDRVQNGPPALKGHGPSLQDTNIGGLINSDPVPEPGTLATFGAGLIGLAALHRRRARR
jgi:hypothetical protein